MAFLGKWELVSEEKLHDFFKCIGSKFVFEKVTLEYEKRQDGTYVETVSTEGNVKSIIFEDGKENKATTLDGEVSSSTFTIKGNTIVHVHDNHKHIVTTTRKAEGDKLLCTYEAEGVPTASSVYNKV